MLDDVPTEYQSWSVALSIVHALAEKTDNELSDLILDISNGTKPQVTIERICQYTHAIADSANETAKKMDKYLKDNAE